MTDTSGWYLDGYLDGERLPRRIPIATLPFRIGRGDNVEGRLAMHHVSDLHAEIFQADDELWLRDHHSANGTFLNRQRVTSDARVREGDIIHISTNEFVLRREAQAAPDFSETICLPTAESGLPERFATGTRELKDLLRLGQVVPHYQPLVRLDDGCEIVGYEVLGRGDHDTLPVAPGHLFRIAESAGLELELSELFRQKGVEGAAALPGSPRIFVNSHPSEMGSDALLDSLRALRERIPETMIVLEAHEAAVQSPGSMRKLRAALDDLNIGLAYDDFGAGQARILELVEVPPDFLKFDISLVREIDRAPDTRRKMLRTLVSMVNDMGIACLAEGLETAGEFEVCRELGFGYGQGYFLGRPAPIAHWLVAPAVSNVS